MLSAITSAVSTVITWIGMVLEALLPYSPSEKGPGDLSELLPLLAIGIAISAVFMGVRLIRKVTWAA